MRISRFYLETDLITGLTLPLPDAVFRHAVQVLRLKVGDPLVVFNGQGGEYQATLVDLGKRQATLQIGTYRPSVTESPLQLTLVQALIKPDKMDFALQKAVELGISAFQPLITKHSVIQLKKEKLERKLAHWQAIAIGACEQSERTTLPAILAPLPLSDYLAQASEATRLMLTPESDTRFADFRATNPQQLAVLIGPEGGFSADEIAQCQTAGVASFKLGLRILRAETASLSVLTLLQQRYGDL